MESAIKLLIIIFVLKGHFTAYSHPNIRPPRIFPIHEETVVDSNGNLTLRCEGLEPITWTYPNRTLSDDNYWSTVNVSISDTPDTRFVYGALLVLTNASYVDTGFYYCHGTTAEKDNKIRSKKIYVYVRDEEHLSLHGEAVQFLTTPQYSNITLPCLPTSPDVSVTLHDGNGDEVRPQEVAFDPRYGYTVNVSIFDTSYSCHFSRNGKFEEMHILLNVFTKTESVPKPYIGAPNNGRTTVGERLVLNCTVTVDFSVFFSLKWTVPNEEGKKSGRIKMTEANPSQGNLGKTGISTLTIEKVEFEDAGDYTCQVEDHSKNTNSVKKEIIVFDRNGSHISLTENNGLYDMETTAGTDSIQWMIEIDAYPRAQTTWYNNHGMEITSGWADGRNSKYSTRTSDNEAFLKIHQIILEDTGVYQLVAFNGLQEKKLNLTLTVSDKPVTHIESKNFHKYGEKSLLKCIAAGYPLPSVYWWFKPCQDDKCSFKPIPRANYTMETKGLQTTSSVNLTAFQTGLVKCYANNSMGDYSYTRGFYVTDVESGFEIWGVDEPSKVALGDTIVIHCAASIYNYTNKMEWRFNGNDSTEYVIKPDKKFSTETKKTEYTHRTTLKIKSITYNETGTYACIVDPKSSDDDSHRYLPIKVNEPKKPKIIKTNMNGTETKVALEGTIRFFCYAEGIPIPTITWMKDNRDWSVMTNHSRLKLSEDNRVLTYQYIQQDDEGVYSCKATNKVGSVQKNMQLVVLGGKGTGSTSLIVAIVFLIILFLGLCTILFVKVKKEKKLRKELRIAGLMNFEKGALENLNPDLGVDDQAELLPYDKKWEFPRDKLKLGKQLGSGAFGVVMKAEAVGLVEGETVTTVAVKMVKRNADYTYIKALASELKIMVHLGKHLNVVNLLGACTKNVTKRELLVIVEYCRFGNLHNYLLRHRDDFVNQIDTKTGTIDTSIGSEILTRTMSVGSNQSGNRAMTVAGVDYRSTPNPSSCATDSTAVCTPTGEDTFVLSNNSVQPEWRSNYRGDYKGNVRPISTHDLLCWAFQVARGMEYLASRKVLHGDLAARNILLAEDNIVKICDFGLAKSMYKSDNYKKKGDGPLPVKWMAVESIRDRVFSTQSDVWSYGIVLWEFFSLARTPYPGMEADERLYNKLVEGYRMDQPEYSTKEIYQIMLDCWNAKPIARPSFTKLAENLGCMLQESVRMHYIELNDPYLLMNNERLEGQSDYLAMLSPPDYGNLASPHDYVNGKSFAEEPEAQTSGYLPMDIFSPRSNETIFDFDVQRKQKMNGEPATGIELVPMLHSNGSTESDTETSPTTPSKSFANPSYQQPPALDKLSEPKNEQIVPTSDNYINMPQQKIAIKNEKDSAEAYANPSYVQMNNKVISDEDNAKNYVNSQSRDWERPFL